MVLVLTLFKLTMCGYLETEAFKRGRITTWFYHDCWSVYFVSEKDIFLSQVVIKLEEED
jgi:hypothetical protein